MTRIVTINITDEKQSGTIATYHNFQTKFQKLAIENSKNILIK